MPMNVSLLNHKPLYGPLRYTRPSPTGTYTITVTATGFSAALQYSADGSNLPNRKCNYSERTQAPIPFRLKMRMDVLLHQLPL
jgi:hypothetical protein